MKKLLLYILLLVSITSCYKEVVNLEPDADLFELYVDNETQNFIYTSRDTSYSIESSSLQVLFEGQLLNLKDIRVRGKSALNFRRKSYGLYLNEPIYIENRYGTETKKMTRFKLIALAMDYTYIENRIAFGLLQEAGIMPLFFKFVELRMNDETQGVYLLIEDPEQYYMEIGSEYILRRGYNHSISDSEYAPSYYFKPIAEYENRFKDIYNQLPLLQGEELYIETAARLDIDSYFRKIGIDYLLQNGDYTDEIYLYSMIEQDTARFHIIPWDYDDIFDEFPHEVGVTWGTGTIFGKRVYDTKQDIYDEIGDKLIYSIEDDFDYTITQDPYLYLKYEEALTDLFEIVDNNLIDKVFTEISAELNSFYESYEVVYQSRYDASQTSKNLWMKNMDEKKAQIKTRLEEMKLQLSIQ